MKEETAPLKTNDYGLQEYLSLGYIYLVILGILTDVIYYKFLGINILNYSGVSDVLMSPVNTLVYDLRILVATILAIGFVYLVYFVVLPALHDRNKDKNWYQKVVRDTEQADRKLSGMKNKKIELVLTFLTFMFLGVKIGMGAATQKRIARGDIKVSHTLIFNEDIQKQVKVVGQNSAYIFYIAEGQKEISIVPISGNIKEIRTIR